MFYHSVLFDFKQIGSTTVLPVTDLTGNIVAAWYHSTPSVVINSKVFFLFTLVYFLKV